MEGEVEDTEAQKLVALDFCKPAVDAMTLPYDVLFELFSFLPDQATICRLMRTCKTMYKHGVRALLRDYIAVTDETIESFCLFMKADMTRCQHLRGLDLPPMYADLDASHVESLVQILHRASNLRDLDLSADILYEEYHAFKAITNLEFLQVLNIRDWYREVESLLASTRSPIRKLVVDFSPDHAPDVYINFLPHLVRLHFLEELSVQRVAWIDEAPAGIRLPKVHTLHLDDCDGVNIPSLVTVFPGLKRLSVWTDCENWNFNSDADLDILRAESISFQQHIGSWQPLDHAWFSPITLYTLAPICKIMTLYTSGPNMTKNKTLSWVRWETALASISPENLHLAIKREGDLVAMVDMIGRLPMSVIRLSLGIDLHLWTSPMEDAFDILRIALGLRVSVTHIDLAFIWTERHERWQRTYFERKSKHDTPSPRIAFLQQFDRLAMAQAIVSKLPSLTYIRLNIVSNEDDSYYTGGLFWAVETVDGERRLKELSKGEGLQGIAIWQYR